MSGSLSLFLKSNKIPRANVFYPAVSELKDENGDTLLWELRAVTTDEDDAIRGGCLRYGGGAGSTPRFDNAAYAAALTAAAVVTPNLHSAELQDAYGVTNDVDLLRRIADLPGEYQELVRRVHKLCGFKTQAELIEEAKN